MDESWKIIYFQSENQETSPVKDFILSLNIPTQAKIVSVLKLLKEYGTRTGAPHIKKLTGTQLWELRVVGSYNIRILYVTIVNKRFLLLHGFIKKKQKTDKKEIKTAEARLSEYKSKNN